ncbi:alpha/beta hydrolase family protein [Enterococcus sp. AZ126]|uniref:alpha/beta hydrolase family protein n=1 Tax=Enterococcus sp. AZ126 TaxID=2774635 RepID=UPI003F28C704
MFKKYLENEQLDFQINRFMEPYLHNNQVQAQIQQSCERIFDLEDWYTEWSSLGKKNHQNEQFELATAYYNLAEFFLPETDPRKEVTYNLIKKNFYKSIDGYCNLDFLKIPYEGVKLPVSIIKKKNAKKWLVFHGGFDSYIEELIRLSISHLSSLTNYNIVMFEGPGQGLPLKEGLTMTYQWEKPIGAVLDYLKLEEVTLMGMSLGGYLALRAAAFDNRVKTVIAFDTFYCMIDSFLMKAPSELKRIPDLSQSSVKSKFDELVGQYAKENIDLQFKLTKAKEILGRSSISEVLINLKDFTLEGIEKNITQDVLLLAGNDDMYVPTYRTGFLQSKLTKASKIETVLFTKKDGGEKHCQVGAKQLAFDKIIEFLQ